MLINLYVSQQRIDRVDHSYGLGFAVVSLEPIAGEERIGDSGEWVHFTQPRLEPNKTVNAPVGCKVVGEPGNRRLHVTWHALGLDGRSVYHLAKTGQRGFSMGVKS